MTWLEQSGLLAVDVANDPLFGGLVPDEQPAAAEELFRRCVDAATALHRQGAPIQADYLTAQDAWIPRDQAALVVRTVRFRKAMYELGIELNRLGLSAHQLMFIQTYFSPEMWSKEESTILRLAGVTQQQFLGWMKQPAFRAEFDTWREEVFEAGKAKAMTALDAKVEAGNMSAIKLKLAMTHRYDPEGQSAEYHRMLTSIFTILDEELRGPEHRGVMQRVGTRMRDAIPGLAQMLQPTPQQEESERILDALPSRPLAQAAAEDPPPAAPQPPTLDEILEATADVPDDEPPLPTLPGDRPTQSAAPASLSGEWQVDLSRPNRARPVD